MQFAVKAIFQLPDVEQTDPICTRTAARTSNSLGSVWDRSIGRLKGSTVLNSTANWSWWT